MLPEVTTIALPALVQRAAAQLASATSAAEVLEARSMANAAYDAAKIAARLAKAKGAFDQVIGKVHRTKADALEIEAMANRRIADEYDAAQERGEVRTQADNNAFSKAEKAGFADIGLTGKDIHKARQIRDAEKADPGVIRRTLDELIEEGEEPTKAAVLHAVMHAIKDTGSRQTKHLSANGKQLAKLRQAWREACPTVRQHFLAEVTEREAA